MTKDVLITVSGLQSMGGESDNIQIITPGSYYHKNGCNQTRDLQRSHGI